MLIQFRVENFLSFQHEVEFSMIAGGGFRMPEHYVAYKDINILKSAVIYGANASGKSNLVKAIFFAQRLILGGIEGVETSNKYFRLDPENINKPSKFEFEIRCCDSYYSYGFSILLAKRQFIDEWLYEIGKGKEKIVFERKLDKKGEIGVKFGLKFKRKEDETRYQLYAKDLKHEQLFLQQINTRNLEGLTGAEPFVGIYNWFKESLTIIFPETKYEGLIFWGTNTELKDTMKSFLDYFDTGIKDIIARDVDFEEEFKNMPENFRLMVLKDLKEGKIKLLWINNVQYGVSLAADGRIKGVKLGLIHTDIKGKAVEFDSGEESDGTIRLFDLVPALDVMRKKPRTFIIDELDRSLHPKLSEGILKLFFDDNKSSESQLIVTTHEAELQSMKLLRSDEIWFIEKGADGASKMFSLSEFKVRQDKEIRKDYLIGRFGAVPKIKHKRRIEKVSK